MSNRPQGVKCHFDKRVHEQVVALLQILITAGWRRACCRFQGAESKANN